MNFKRPTLLANAFVLLVSSVFAVFLSRLYPQGWVGSIEVKVIQIIGFTDQWGVRLSVALTGIKEKRQAKAASYLEKLLDTCPESREIEMCLVHPRTSRSGGDFLRLPSLLYALKGEENEKYPLLGAYHSCGHAQRCVWKILSAWFSWASQEQTLSYSWLLLSSCLLMFVSCSSVRLKDAVSWKGAVKWEFRLTLRQ